MSVDDLRELYQEVILDHNKNPRNYGELSDANYTADGNNPLCGDRLTVYLKLDDNELVNEVAFTGKGCAISIASASMMTTVVKGKTVKHVNDLFDKFHKLCTGESDEAELDEFLSHDFMPRYGGGIGVTRMISAMKRAGLLVKNDQE